MLVSQNASPLKAPNHPHFEPVLTWFDTAERDLPWRSTTPWGVVVSEFMLQQTPVARVIPRWHSWMKKWPTPSDLAGAPQSEAIKMWENLGYPRRAIRLHATATHITTHHDGEVPDTYQELITLPGIGDYTANAILAFAFHQRSVVLDVNIRRLLARAWLGLQSPTPSVSAIERKLAEDLLPKSAATASRWAAASMELGALICTAKNPDCDSCPLRDTCAWKAGGHQQSTTTVRKQAKYEGSDRAERGRILKILRDSTTLKTKVALGKEALDHDQFERALNSLITDGLITRTPQGRYRLPT